MINEKAIAETKKQGDEEEDAIGLTRPKKSDGASREAVALAEEEMEM